VDLHFWTNSVSFSCLCIRWSSFLLFVGFIYTLTFVMSLAARLDCWGIFFLNYKFLVFYVSTDLNKARPSPTDCCDLLQSVNISIVLGSSLFSVRKFIVTAK